MDCVRPGDELVFAIFAPSSELITLDFPTFERPRNATSGRAGAGKWSTLVAAVINLERTRTVQFRGFRGIVQGVSGCSAPGISSSAAFASQQSLGRLSSPSTNASSRNSAQFSRVRDLARGVTDLYAQPLAYTRPSTTPPDRATADYGTRSAESFCCGAIL